MGAIVGCDDDGPPPIIKRPKSSLPEAAAGCRRCASEWRHYKARRGETTGVKRKRISDRHHRFATQRTADEPAKLPNPPPAEEAALADQGQRETRAMSTRAQMAPLPLSRSLPILHTHGAEAPEKSPKPPLLPALLLEAPAKSPKSVCQRTAGRGVGYGVTISRPRRGCSCSCPRP